MTVRWKLHLSVILLALTLIGNAAVLVHSHLRTASAIEEVKLTEHAISTIFEVSLFARDYLDSDDERAALQWRGAYRRLGGTLERIAEFPLDDEGEWLVRRRLKESHLILGSLFERLAAGRSSPGQGHDEAEKLIGQSLSMRANMMVADVYKLSAINNAAIAMERRVFVFMLGLSVGVSALAGLFILFVNRRILVSLGALRQASDRIGAREFQAPVTLAGNDEFAALAETVNAMASRIDHDYRELRDSEERYLLLFEHSPQPMWVFDESDLKFLAVNNRAVEHYGYSRDEFAAMTLCDIRPMEDVAALKLEIERSIGREGYGEWRHRKKGGAIIDVDIHAVPITWGSRCAKIVQIQDITERNKAEALVAQSNSLREEQACQLRRANEELEQFAYVASHDLREPLRMVSAYLSLLEHRLDGSMDAECREFLEFARSGAKRMDRLILDLLEYSRIGRMEAVRERVSLAELAGQAAADLHFAIDEATARVEIGELPEVMGNPNELERLFQNLIGNAVKYCAIDRSPVVTISAERDGQSWRITVADNGIGIAPEYFERVFGVFQRLHGRNKYDGTGIGLASCKKIVEHHHGRIWVESREGEGSNFRFTLPDSLAPSVSHAPA